MVTKSSTDTKLHFIARSAARPEDLSDPRRFAWEILRRRADYVGLQAETEWIEGATAPIELIQPVSTATSWGLRFRGSP